MAGQLMESKQFSCKINEVLSHVGVNDEIVSYRRNCFLQMECNKTVHQSAYFDVFHFGSQSEGSTTIGINSDIDSVHIFTDSVVVTDTSDRVSDDILYKFQMDKFTKQGYCYIKDISFNMKTHNFNEQHLSFRKHHKPTTTYMMSSGLLDSFEGDTEKEGPAWYIGGSNRDYNILPYAFYCTSWPFEVTNVFQLNQTKRHWPSDRLLHDVLQSRCFVVPKGSDIGPDSDIEWRVSFSCAERLLMFDLNIIQIRCYILMKYIKSTFLDNLPDCKGVISSYICKTVLFHTVSQTFKDNWVAEELLNNFNKCLHTLRQFIDKGNCPHFIMPMNNLLSNKLDETTRANISMELQRIIETNGNVLFDIKFDHFGELLRDEEVNLQECDAKHIQNILFNDLIGDFGFHKVAFVNDSCIEKIDCPSVLNALTSSSNQTSIGVGLDDPVDIDDRNNKTRNRVTTSLNVWKKTRDSTPVTEVRMHEAIQVWEGICCTLLGSLQASAEIKFNHEISSETLLWLQQGMECSQVASAHLKLASVLFLVGDLYVTNTLLNVISKKLDKRHIVYVCSCRKGPISTVNSDDIPLKIFTNKRFFVDMIRENVADCVVYIFEEINSCPKELQYEMYRVIFNEKPTGNYLFISYLYVAAAPQLPYLFFLQYKLYKKLGMLERCKQALTDLICTLITDMCPNHQDTVCNLIGQCLELEGEYICALKYYCLSLKIEPVYNAAKILICCNLFKQFQLRNHHD